MTDDLTGVVDLGGLGEHAERFAAEMREQIVRDRATVQALQEYLDRPSPTQFTENTTPGEAAPA